MTTGGRFFRSILATEDQSSPAIERITQKMHVLNTATAEVATRLGRLASAQLGAATAAQESGRATEGQTTRAQILGENLDKLSQTGVITSSGLRRMSQQATLLAQSTGNEGLAGSLQETRRELEILSPTMARAEEQAQATGVKFKFMGDVSEATQLRFRQLSAASQGVLLGMSALQGQVLGVAFSLIFLQFSGFLRLSLGIAAATAIFIPFLRRFKEFLSQRREVQNLTSALFIVTESLQSFVLAESVAEKLSKALGLTGGEAGLFERAIAQAIVALRKINEEPTEEKLKVFTAAFAIARAEGLDFEQAMAAAFKALEESKSGFVTVTTGAGDARIGLEELERRGVAAILRLTQGTVVPVETARRVISGLPEDAQEAFENLVAETESGFVNLESVLALFPKSSRIAAKNTFAILQKETGEGLAVVEERWKKAWQEAIPASMKDAAERHIPPAVRDIINALDPIEQKLRAIQTLQNIVFESQRSNRSPIKRDPLPIQEDPGTGLPIITAGFRRGATSGTTIIVNAGTVVGEDGADELAGIVAARVLRNVNLGNSVSFSPTI